MKIVRCTKNKETVYAELIGEKVYPIVGKPYEEVKKDGREWALSEVKLLAPAEPTKIVAVGDNYLDHIKEMNDAIPEEPVIFLKPNSAILNPGETILYHYHFLEAIPNMIERPAFLNRLVFGIQTQC